MVIYVIANSTQRKTDLQTPIRCLSSNLRARRRGRSKKEQPGASERFEAVEKWYMGELTKISAMKTREGITYDYRASNATERTELFGPLSFPVVLFLFSARRFSTLSDCRC